MKISLFACFVAGLLLFGCIAKDSVVEQPKPSLPEPDSGWQAAEQEIKSLSVEPVEIDDKDLEIEPLDINEEDLSV